MKKTEIIKIWRRRLKEELEDLSSLKFQKEIWVDRSNPNIVWDWSEALCGYFDDLGFNNYKMDFNEGESEFSILFKKMFLSKEEINILKTFNEKFHKYTDKISYYPSTKEDYQKILSDPEWIRITKMAKDILTKIDFDTLPENQK